MKAIVIPVEGPIELREIDDTLDSLQGIVGGFIQAIPLPAFLEPSGRATAYLNEEGKLLPDCAPNMRATDLLVPGVGLFFGDYIAGTLIVCGFNPATGENEDVPERIIMRVNLIADESGTPFVDSTGFERSECPDCGHELRIGEGLELGHHADCPKVSS